MNWGGYPNSTLWSEYDDIFLRDNWGKMPASKIGEALGGRSRNSVLGRAHRLGLEHLISPPFSQSKPVNPDKRHAQQRDYERRRTAAKRTGIPFTKQERQEAVVAAVGKCPATTLPALEALRAIADEPFKHEVTVMPTFVKPPPPRPATILKGGECCWPIGEPGKPDFKFCCEPAEFGKSYCKTHRKIAYVPKHRPVVAAE